jgi:SAM-dependent methyltransferase
MTTQSDRPDPARSFGSAADAYDRGRPSYPREAVSWLVGDEPVSVLELGAGTGKLTEVLVALGHDVLATDPDERMLDVLSARLPDVRATVGTAEQIPAGPASYDVVVAGQAFHWFDLDRALPEIARVLRPGGRLSLVWNLRDERIPWVRRLGGLIGKHDQQADPTGPLDDSALFSAVDSASFRHWQVVNRESIQDLVLSRSNITVLPDADRERKRAEVLAFYDDYGRGMDGMQLPYTASCFRARVVDRPKPVAPPVDEAGPGDRAPGAEDGPVSDDGSDADVLLIDFR